MLELSYPGAIGFGRFTKGGKGGRVIVVTNGNDSGPGSLRDALMQTGPRIIVFDRVRDIVLNSNLRPLDANSNVTIAGQTAGGVRVRNRQVNIACAEVIIRGMMFAYGGSADDTALMIGRWRETGAKSVHHIIIGNCLICWGRNEQLSATRDLADFTVQDSIITQGIPPNSSTSGTSSGAPFVLGSTDLGYWPTRGTFARNFWSDVRRRTPWLKICEAIEWANNVYWNPGHQWYGPVAVGSNDYTPHGDTAHILSNVWFDGPDSLASQGRLISMINKANVGGKVWAKDNLWFDKNGVLHTRPVFGGSNSPVGTVEGPVFEGSGLEIFDTADMEAYVMAHAGVSPKNREWMEKRAMDHFAERIGEMIRTPSMADTIGFKSTDLPVGKPLGEIPTDPVQIEAWLNSFYEEPGLPPEITTEPVPGGVSQADFNALAARVAALEAVQVPVIPNLEARLAAIESEVVRLDSRLDAITEAAKD